MLHAVTRQPPDVRAASWHKPAGPAATQPAHGGVRQWQRDFGNRAVRRILQPKPALAQSGGEPLPAQTRRTMEGAFGREFSRVRVHHGPEAERISGQLDALAFTHRNHVYFGSGMYDVAGASGKRLLAHELTHVVQQGYADPRLHTGAAARAGVIHAAVPSIQRKAAWDDAGKVHPDNNLADVIVNGGHPGNTLPVLNGTILDASASPRDALAKPALATSSPPRGDVSVKVASAPENTGSFDETVLAPGPWTVDVPKAAVVSALKRIGFPDTDPALAACSSQGTTTFRAIGKPDDRTVSTKNRGHEDHHAEGYKAAFDRSIVAWDSKLTRAASSGRTFTAATEEAAIAKVYAAMGGTPDNIADAFVHMVNAFNSDFHGRPTGGEINLNNPKAVDHCLTSSVEATNPFVP
jgi:hypothetical protein